MGLQVTFILESRRSPLRNAAMLVNHDPSAMLVNHDPSSMLCSPA